MVGLGLLQLMEHLGRSVMGWGLVHLVKHLRRGMMGLGSPALMALVDALSVITLLAWVGCCLGRCLVWRWG